MAIPGGWRANCAPRPGLRRWENHHSFRNSTAALFALGGLAVVDIVLLLPLLFAVMLILLVIAS